jgi:hypothetical protein
MHAHAARNFAQALSFRREAAAQQLALGQLFRERPPAIRGPAEPIDEVRQFGVIHSVNWLGVETALRVLLWLFFPGATTSYPRRCQVD